jgi:molybdopterin converting factor small subunit
VTTVVFSAEMRRYTGEAQETEVSGTDYRTVVKELRGLFPALPDSVFGKTSVAIDGVLIQTPLLETFDGGSELVFIARIAGG